MNMAHRNNINIGSGVIMNANMRSDFRRIIAIHNATFVCPLFAEFFPMRQPAFATALFT
jgi:hypothetical protein